MLYILDKGFLIKKFLLGATTCKGTMIFHKVNVAVLAVTQVSPSVTMFLVIWIILAWWLGCRAISAIQLVDLKKVRFVHSIVLSQLAFLWWPNYIIRASNFGHGGLVFGFLEGPCAVLHYRGCVVGTSLVRATFALCELTFHPFFNVVPVNFDILVTISSRLLMPPS